MIHFLLFISTSSSSPRSFSTKTYTSSASADDYYAHYTAHVGNPGSDISAVALYRVEIDDGGTVTEQVLLKQVSRKIKPITRYNQKKA